MAKRIGRPVSRPPGHFYSTFFSDEERRQLDALQEMLMASGWASVIRTLVRRAYDERTTVGKGEPGQ